MAYSGLISPDRGILILFGKVGILQSTFVTPGRSECTSNRLPVSIGSVNKLICESGVASLTVVGVCVSE